jgi:site-specific recombinase XerD
VDFLRQQVRVDLQMVRVRGEGVVLSSKLKTRAAYRTLPLPDVIAQALATHMQAFPPHPELGLIFANESGRPIQQYPFSQVFASAVRRAGLPKWATPHDLRHFYASALIRSGASVKVVQVRLGHESAKTTLDIYSKLFPNEEDRTRVAIDAVPGASCGVPVGFTAGKG